MCAPHIEFNEKRVEGKEVCVWLWTFSLPQSQQPALIRLPSWIFICMFFFSSRMRSLQIGKRFNILYGIRAYIVTSTRDGSFRRLIAKPNWKKKYERKNGDWFSIVCFVFHTCVGSNSEYIAFHYRSYLIHFKMASAYKANFWMNCEGVWKNTRILRANNVLEIIVC